MSTTQHHDNTGATTMSASLPAARHQGTGVHQAFAAVTDAIYHPDREDRDLHALQYAAYLLRSIADGSSVVIRFGDGCDSDTLNTVLYGMTGGRYNTDGFLVGAEGPDGRLTDIVVGDFDWDEAGMKINGRLWDPELEGPSETTVEGRRFNRLHVY